jgi:nicotinamide-nucleotide amidase
MYAPVAEILSQGDEVVTGQTVDTNAAWLAERLTALGFNVTRHVAAPDELGAIREVILDASARADVCICTGGLGPTDDDLTAEAAAKAAGRSLVHHPEAEARIRELYKRMGRPMPQVNVKQAWLPEGVVRLDNDWGTAPGFALEIGHAWFAFLPGVPREMKAMFEERVLPRLQARFDLAVSPLYTIRTVGVGESDLQERIGKVANDAVTVSYRTILPENHVKLRFRSDTKPAVMASVVADVVARIGVPVFTVEGPGDAPVKGIGETVGRLLVARGETLAVAESCTGGLIASMCTTAAGASAFFVEGCVTYANTAKVRRLGVSEADLAAHGAVSEPVARAMAEGIRASSGATWGIGVTGIAGPDGGTAEKPVGTVHIAIAGPSGTIHHVVRLPGGRDRVQSLAATGALDLLRRTLGASAQASPA